MANYMVRLKYREMERQFGNAEAYNARLAEIPGVTVIKPRVCNTEIDITDSMVDSAVSAIQSLLEGTKVRPYDPENQATYRMPGPVRVRARIVEGGPPE